MRKEKGKQEIEGNRWKGGERKKTGIKEEERKEETRKIRIHKIKRQEWKGKGGEKGRNGKDREVTNHQSKNKGLCLLLKIYHPWLMGGITTYKKQQTSFTSNCLSWVFKASRLLSRLSRLSMVGFISWSKAKYSFIFDMCCKHCCNSLEN